MLTLNTVGVPSPPPASTTAEAYARHARRCAAVLGWLNAALWDHGFSAAEEPDNRGFVVELAVLEHRLAEALAALSGQGEPRVEQMLASLEAQA